MKNDQNKTWKVYTHTTPDGMVYVGITCQKYLSNRWHKSAYKETALQPYIERYGWENITHQVIYTTPDRDEAYQVEEEMRQYYEEKGCCINKQRSGLIKAKNEKAYSRQYYQDNPEYREKHKDYMRQWGKDHNEERAAYMRQYRAKKKAEKLLQSGQIEMPLAS